MLIGLVLSLGFGFQPGCPAAQRGQARLEFRLLDQPLRVAVDQPLGCTAGLGQLTVKGIEFEPMRRGVHRVQAPLILRDHQLRVVEQSEDLSPDRFIKLINRNQPGTAPERTMEAAAVRAATAIIPPRSVQGDTP